MRDNKSINDMINLIEITIDLNDKLYEKTIKNDTINLKKELKLSLNLRSNIALKNLSLLKSITTRIIASLYL